MTKGDVIKLTQSQEAELKQLRLSFPFRIVYGAISPTGEWFASAVLNMRVPNKLAREGWKVFTVQA